MSDFKSLQQSLASNVRFNNSAEYLDVEHRRLAIYQRLVFNNLFGLLSGGFKRLRQAVGDNEFRQLVRSFLESGVSKTPYFAEISGEFCSWLQEQSVVAWQKELAVYERAGIAIDVDTLDWPSPDEIKSQPQRVHFSPAIALLSFDYAIHLFAPDSEPQQTPTYILLYRNPHNKLRYKLLNAASFSLLALLLQGESLSDALGILATRMNIEINAIANHAQTLLLELRREGAIVALPA